MLKDHAGLWRNLKRCFVADDAVLSLPTFKKQRCHSDVDDVEKSDVAGRRVTAIQQSGLALAVSLARNVALDFLQQVDTQGMWRRTRVAVQLALAIELLNEPLLGADQCGHGCRCRFLLKATTRYETSARALGSSVPLAQSENASCCTSAAMPDR